MEPLQVNGAEMARSLSSPYADSVDSFIASRHDLRPSTLKGYRMGLQRFEAFVGTGAAVSALSAKAANAYITSCLKRKRKFLAHHDARSLRLFSAWLVRANVFAVDPLSGVAVPHQPRVRRKPFTVEEVALIRETARRSGMGERDEAIVVTGLGCGVRLDEMVNLAWPNDLDLKRGFLYVRAAKSDAGVRRVPLDPEVRAILDVYVKDVRQRPPEYAGPLFLNRHGDAFTYWGFAAIFRRLRGRLPRELDFKIHRARNTYITDQLRSGTDLYVTMKLAGHKSPKVTEGYAGELSDDELRRLTKPSFSVLHGRRKAS
jgi:site-specific recombinase XerD